MSLIKFIFSFFTKRCFYNYNLFDFYQVHWSGCFSPRFLIFWNRSSIYLHSWRSFFIQRYLSTAPAYIHTPRRCFVGFYFYYRSDSYPWGFRPSRVQNIESAFMIGCSLKISHNQPRRQIQRVLHQPWHKLLPNVYTNAKLFHFGDWFIADLT